MEEYRRKGGRYKDGLPKEDFPSLLLGLWEKMEANFGQNSISGFRKCGIYPLNANQVLSRLPPNTPEKHAELGNALTDFLRENRQGPPRVERRKKRLSVPAGCSVSMENLGEPPAAQVDADDDDGVLYRLPSIDEDDEHDDTMRRCSRKTLPISNGFEYNFF